MTPKQAYDQAAKEFCDHVLDCPDCTMTGPHCEVGNGLLQDENETWNRYMASKAPAPHRAR